MTEQEKMKLGVLYNAIHDQDLISKRNRCHDLCWQYNQIKPSSRSEMSDFLKSMLGSTGEHVRIELGFWCDYGYNIHVGEDFYANRNLTILDGAEVRFGHNVFIGPDCGFHTAGHPIDTVRRNQGIEYSWPISVGDNVWFGAGVQVMPGVTIGSDTVIGAGSVVVRDIPDHAVAAGNPCRVLRQITAEDEETVFDFRNRKKQ
ncbi:MAG: sugar O-acetyltransferase [Erysipelotrichia bacterium]|nr:sugar O-acetyltransferase [Erysipelotrichia bacterium]